jgi:uncharacterized cupin superfamily protein
MRHANVRNAYQVDVREMIKGRHDMRLHQLGKPAGSIELSATLTEVAPGGISFPRHAHYVNEEAIYVLSGSGEARIGDAPVPVRPGDWIALPTGPEHAHQMINVSTVEPLVYLCISTMRGAEIVEYSDSGKIGAGVADPKNPVGLPPPWHVPGRQRHARLLGERARGGLSLVRPGHSLGDGTNPTRRGKRNRDDPAIQGKGVHWSSPAVTHGVEPRTAVSARLAH